MAQSELRTGLAESPPAIRIDAPSASQLHSLRSCSTVVPSFPPLPWPSWPLLALPQLWTSCLFTGHWWSGASVYVSPSVSPPDADSMTSSDTQRLAFEAAVKAIAATSKGNKARMCAALRDLFAGVLGYEKTAIMVAPEDTGGRPDITISAPAATTPRATTPGATTPGATISSSRPWIVGVCSDEPGTLHNAGTRRSLYAANAGFFTADTAFFLMADPEMLVVRRVGSTRDDSMAWQGLDHETLAARLAWLRAEFAGIPQAINAFLGGDDSSIARDRLTAPANANAETRLAARITQNIFFDTLRETTGRLQQATLNALQATRDARHEIAVRTEPSGNTAREKYPGIVPRAESKPPQLENSTVQRPLLQKPELTRLTLEALPAFAAHSGLDPVKDADRLERLFASQTSSLLLARILLVRFLEDHGFFDREEPQGTRRHYLCNRGVHAFRQLDAHFGHGTGGLPGGVGKRGNFRLPTFLETELDWVMGLPAPELREAIEWALFRFARFDFATVRGDLMTGVHDRLLDRRQRKEQGEVYTPPSIARYLLNRLALPRDAEVFDPACGSGIFLIERYREAIGEAAGQGSIRYAEARRLCARLAGNDINFFSAALTQAQLIWHLLPFRDEVRQLGLPDLRISSGTNSLVPGSLPGSLPDSFQDPAGAGFARIDRSGYDAVIGNPPYVRSERAGALEPAAQDVFTAVRRVEGKTFSGITVGANAYTLFIYRALDHWCRQPENGGPAGKLAFVVPLAFCVSSEASDLRALFQSGQRWAIREIVDLELIWRQIFDVDVLAMLLIAEATPAAASDSVRIRLADQSCVSCPPGAKRPTFRFDHLPEQVIAYDALFAPDGRIVTRLTPRRATILTKLWNNPSLRDAAMQYWTRRGEKARRSPPDAAGSAPWQEHRLIREGLAKRGQVHFRNRGGHRLFKGENVTASRLAGVPVFEKFDVSKASSPSIWAYPEILPKTLYALPILAQLPVAAPFNPAEIAMENTVTLFGPRADLADFPFDVLLLSSIYGFFHVIANRRSYQNRIRGHIYPTAVAALPWNDALKAHGVTLREIGARLCDACERRFSETCRRATAAAALGLKPLKDLVRAMSNTKLTRSDAFADEPAISIELSPIEPVDEAFVLSLNAEKTHRLIFSREDVAQLAAAGLAQLEGSETTWSQLLQAPVPVSSAMAADLARLHRNSAPEKLDAAIAAEIEKLDALVGQALGLTPSDITFIRKEMIEDPLLARVRPRYPFFVPRQHGRRKNLERKDRYRRSA